MKGLLNSSIALFILRTFNIEGFAQSEAINIKCLYNLGTTFAIIIVVTGQVLTFKITTMKKVLLFLAILTWSCTALVAQHHDVDVNINFPNYLKYGESYYSNDYQGVKSLMYDLQTTDQDIYVKILPAFKNIQQKRKKAIWVGAGGVVVGSALSVVGLSSVMNSVNSANAENSSLKMLDFKGAGLIILGGSVFTTSIMASALMFPRDSDYYNFINVHNRINKKQKIEWKVGISPFAYNGIGLNLGMRF